MTTNYHLQLINKELRKAIKRRDRQQIRQLINEAENLDLQKVSDGIFSKFEDLWNKANTITAEVV